MTRLRRRRRARSEAGSLSLETAILAPVLIMFLLLMIAAGRIYNSGNVVDTAARNAARAASLERTGTAAHNAGVEVAKQALHEQGLQCTTSFTEITTAGFSAPIGEPASTTATVTCTVRLADIGLPGLPGAKTLESSFTSSIDSYRQR